MANRCYAEPNRNSPSNRPNYAKGENSYGKSDSRNNGRREHGMNALEGEEDIYSVGDRGMYGEETDNEVSHPKGRAPLSGELVGAIF